MAALRTPREIADWAANVQQDLAKHLAQREQSSHRVITLEASYAKLTKLSLTQDALLRESLRCLEYGLYRPAHVSSWTAFIDFLHMWAAESARLAILKGARPKWVLNDVKDFGLYTDYAFIESLKVANLITNNMMKALHGLLNKRNECAHPDEYDPTINDTLGYVDELMKRIAAIQKLP